MIREGIIKKTKARRPLATREVGEKKKWPTERKRRPVAALARAAKSTEDRRGTGAHQQVIARGADQRRARALSPGPSFQSNRCPSVDIEATSRAPSGRAASAFSR